jgi:hypothetical protein
LAAACALRRRVCTYVIGDVIDAIHFVFVVCAAAVGEISRNVLKDAETPALGAEIYLWCIIRL